MISRMKKIPLSLGLEGLDKGFVKAQPDELSGKQGLAGTSTEFVVNNRPASFGSRKPDGDKYDNKAWSQRTRSSSWINGTLFKDT